MKKEKKFYFEVSSKDLNESISQFLGRTFDCFETEDPLEDILLYVHKMNLPASEEYLKSKDKINSLNIILNYMAGEGLIEEGEYKIVCK